MRANPATANDLADVAIKAMAAAMDALVALYPLLPARSQEAIDRSLLGGAVTGDDFRAIADDLWER
jgi:hypothetical protein